MLIGGVVLLVACESDPSTDPFIERSDSAGVEVVVSSDLPAPLLQVDSIPDLSLGGPEAVGPEAFGRVENVVVGSDESIWVSDRQAADVKVFNPDGSHRVTVGGRGNGPGEFQLISLLGAAGDSVAVHDQGTGRLTWFALDGKLLGTVRVESRQGTRPLVYDVSEDGRLVGVESQTLSADELESGSTFGGTVRFSIWSTPTAPATRFTTEPTAKFIWLGGGATTAVPFTANAQVAAGHHVDVVAGTSFEVRRFDSSGSLRRIARIERDPTSVDGAARADFRQFAENSMPPTRRDAALDALDHPSVPGFAPAYRFLVVGSDGSSWAYRYAPIPMNEPWDVFLPDGAFAGAVAVPSRFHITAATEDFVYGYWTDDLGVHHVRRYRIIRDRTGRW